MADAPCGEFGSRWVNSAAVGFGGGSGSQSRRRRYKVFSSSSGKQEVSDFYILEGKETVKVNGLEEWSRRMDLTDRHVAITEVAPGVTVSTVFLGLDHRFAALGEGPPILFETMVFNDYGDDGSQERYSTWDEAEAGHQRIVDEQRRKLA